MIESNDSDVPRRDVAIFTISSNNYMPYTRTFVDSSVAVHHDADHFLCLADERLMTVDYPASCKLVLAKSLSIPNFDSFSFRYDIMEFNTAVKPSMILHLFALGYEQVVYFDPDIKVYQPITPVFDALNDGASIVLTPHVTQPAEVETPPDDVTIMSAGVYNLGFVAFGRHDGVESVLRWWARRLRYQCINAQAQGIFVDQKFVDLVPGFLSDVAILRDTTLNVAYWNLSQRRLDKVGDDWLIDGRKLVFFHFSGYDPRNSHQLSKHTRMFAADNSAALNELLEDYQADLFNRDLKRMPRANYRYDRFTSGTRIPTFVRHYFRDTYPTWDGDPFDTFEAHLHQPAPDTAFTGDGSVCTNLMRHKWETEPYLRATFDIADATGVKRYAEWFIQHGHVAGVEPQLIYPVVDRIALSRRRRTRRVAFREAEDAVDVSVISYLRAGTGVAEAGRLTLRALDSGERTVEGLDVMLNVVSSRGDSSCEALLSETASGRVQIFNVNADQLPLVQEHVADRLRPDAYRISVPFWELAVFPEAWIAAFDRVDEIWAPTRFIQSALITRVRKPVIRMPIALDFSAPQRFKRSHYSLPESRFLFLFSFDFLSFSGRKNPAAVIDAFRFAFAGRSLRGDVSLVIKCVNAAFAPTELDALRRDLGGELDIHFIDRELTRAEMLGLVAVSDCVVSLHRSEGLGLLIAEAMVLGIPVIATDYSATTELISPRTGYPIDYKLVPLNPGDYPFAEGQLWAQPDLSHAAWQMRYVVEQSGRNADLIAAAKRHIAAEHGIDAVRALQSARLAELGV